MNRNCKCIQIKYSAEGETTETIEQCNCGKWEEYLKSRPGYNPIDEEDTGGNRIYHRHEYPIGIDKNLNPPGKDIDYDPIDEIQKVIDKNDANSIREIRKILKSYKCLEDLLCKKR